MKYVYLATFLLAQFLLGAQSQVRYKLEHNNGYFYAYGTPADPKGLLFIIPDFNQTEEELLQTTQIADLAYKHGIVTIVIPCGKKIFADREVMKLLREATGTAINNYNMKGTGVIIGGHGAGGTIALKYAANCLQFSNDYPFSPAGVFAVESPTDLIHLYESFARTIEHSNKPELVLKAKLYKSLLEEGLGGSPEQESFNYEIMTPFNASDASAENIKMFERTPIRLYNDTDVPWNMKNLRISALDMNMVSASSMINILNIKGNTKAEMIKTNLDSKVLSEKKIASRTGVDDVDLLKWMLRTLNISF